MKSGTPYQRAVAEVIGVLDRGATVVEGTWVTGPDGRRDRDVHVTGIADGRERHILIECKDYNPGSTGKVGIGLVDALESKRRDLAVDWAVICSNAGFSGDAIRKASRVGIGLMSVLKEGDKRVRFLVSEDQYIRQLKVESLTISLTGPMPIELGVPFESILFRSLPVGNWVCHRVMAMLGMNPIVAGSFVDACRFVDPVEMTFANRSVVVTQMDANVTVSGSWFVQRIEIDATAGVYDWIRRRVRLGPSSQYHLKDVNVRGGTEVDAAPDWVTKGDLRPGEVTFGLLHIEGLGPVEPRPALDEFVRKEDLSLAVPAEVLARLDGTAKGA